MKECYFIQIKINKVAVPNNLKVEKSNQHIIQFLIHMVEAVCLFIKTHSMLCMNSPFGSLNFLIFSADADTKQSLQNGNMILAKY